MYCRVAAWRGRGAGGGEGGEPEAAGSPVPRAGEPQAEARKKKNQTQARKKKNQTETQAKK